MRVMVIFNCFIYILNYTYTYIAEKRIQIDNGNKDNLLACNILDIFS